MPDSQPLDVETAFHALDAIGGADRDLVTGACAFLERLGPGVGCLTEAYRDYPRAPHWADWALPPDLNPTAGIAAMLWKWGIDHPWREAATAFCWEQIDSGWPADAHGFGEMLSFLASVGDRERAGAVIAAIRADVGGTLGGLRMFRLDPSAPGYGVTPLHFAPRPTARGSACSSPRSSRRTSTTWSPPSATTAAGRSAGRRSGPPPPATAGEPRRSGRCARCARSAASRSRGFLSAAPDQPGAAGGEQ